MATREVKTKAELEETMKNAPGPVLVDVMAEGCGACEEEKPMLEKLASDCGDKATVVVVNDTQADKPLQDLLTEMKVDGTPTLLYAKSGQDFLDKKTEEVEPDEKLRRRLKCAR